MAVREASGFEVVCTSCGRTYGSILRHRGEAEQRMELLVRYDGWRWQAGHLHCSGCVLAALERLANTAGSPVTHKPALGP